MSRSMVVTTTVLSWMFKTQIVFGFSCIGNIGCSRTLNRRGAYSASGYKYGLVRASLQKQNNALATASFLRKEMGAIPASSSSASPSHVVDSILDKTLLSVEECVRVYVTNSILREKDDKEKSTKKSLLSDAMKETQVSDEDANLPIMFVDASWWHKGEFSGPGRGRQIFEKGPRIPGSIYVDIDDIAMQFQSSERALPHMLPTPELFSAAMDAFGITNNHHIIIYARDTVIFTPRTWFLFRAMGHDPSKLHLMQGSLEQFLEEASNMGVALSVENEESVVVPRAKDMDLSLDTKYQVDGGSGVTVKNICDMKKVMDVVSASKTGFGDDSASTTPKSNRNTIIVDSRGSSYAKGHIPGSIHIPYASFISQENALQLKSVEEMRKMFADAGVDLDASSKQMDEFDIICSCGSGVSACHIFLGLELCGRNVDVDLPGGRTMVYDGSWAEWGSDPNTPKET